MQDSDPAILTYGQLSDFVDRVKSLAPLSGATDPDITTPAFHLGQRYINTTTNKEFYCVEIPPLGDTGFVWLSVDTTYSNFVGTDGVTAGSAGLVPAPAITDTDKFLKSDGTWATAGGGGGPTVQQNLGTSTTDVVSQAGVTYALYNNDYPNRQNIGIGSGVVNTGTRCVAIGKNASASTEGSIALGEYSQAYDYDYAMAIGSRTWAGARNSVALGRGAWAQYQGEINVGINSYDTEAGKGYNNTNFRLISGVHDPVGVNDAATKGYVDGKILTNAGAPTTATVGAVGQLLQDSTNGKLYICTVASGGSYTWSEVGSGGGSSVTVVQTPGNSQTDVMSQDAATKLIYPNYSSFPNIIEIGTSAMISAWSHLAVGNGSQAAGYATALGSGDANLSGAKARNQYSIAIGSGADVKSDEGIAIGNATVPASARGSIAIGDGSGGNINANGMVDFGTSSTSNGYNSTNYRLITGVHDPQGAHDVATKGYVDSAAPTITMTTVDPGEGQPLGANEFIAVYSAV